MLRVHLTIFYLIATTLGTESPNLALNKPVWMSSEFFLPGIDSAAWHAVDGSTASDWAADQCAHTNEINGLTTSQAWLVIDLLGQYNVYNVTIYNREDCCGERLHDFSIEVFETNPSRNPSAEMSLCAHYPGVFGLVRSVICDEPVRGRFVRIINNPDKVLHVCEIEVREMETENGCMKEKLNIKPGSRFISSSVELTKAMSRSDCVTRCYTGADTCLAVNYNTATTDCELITRPQPTDTLVTESDWVYVGNDA